LSKAYDLFKEDGESGKPIWVETVIGLGQMKKRLRKLTALKPGKYLIYCPTKAQFVEPFKKFSLQPNSAEREWLRDDSVGKRCSIRNRND
jgi:hypothetical protein